MPTYIRDLITIPEGEEVNKATADIVGPAIKYFMDVLDSTRPDEERAQAAKMLLDNHYEISSYLDAIKKAEKKARVPKEE